MLRTFIKRLFVIVVILGLFFVVYSYINPDGASNLLDKAKNVLPESVSNYFGLETNSSWDTQVYTDDGLIVTWTTISIVTWDVTRGDTGTQELPIYKDTWSLNLDNALDQNLASTWSAVNTWVVVATWTAVTTWAKTVSWSVALSWTTTKKVVPNTSTTSTSWKLSDRDINDAKKFVNEIVK